jgi:hypothetical protein
MISIFLNFIRTYGGLSYDAGELLLGKFADGATADDCAFEIKYLFEGIPVEVDGNWIAIYLKDEPEQSSLAVRATPTPTLGASATRVSYVCHGVSSVES